jgi:hypothetical protein
MPRHRPPAVPVSSTGETQLSMCSSLATMSANIGQQPPVFLLSPDNRTMEHKDRWTPTFRRLRPTRLGRFIFPAHGIASTQVISPDFLIGFPRFVTNR